MEKMTERHAGSAGATPALEEDRVHPDLMDRILRTEMDYPKYISNFEEKPFGVIYHDQSDPDNPYLNHAIIFPDQVEDLPGALDAITQFYLERGIQPRVRQPFTKGYFMDHATEFRIKGYDIQLFAPTRFMLLENPNRIQATGKLEIRELTEWDPRVAEDILIPDGNGQAVEEIKRNIMGRRYRVLVGYLQGKAVSMVTIYYGDHGVARLASAETAAELRGQGYARELISTIVDMHRRESSLPLYLWPQNITAEKIFREAGFTDFFQEELAIATYHS